MRVKIPPSLLEGQLRLLHGQIPRSTYALYLLTAVLSGAPWRSTISVLHPFSTKALVLMTLALTEVMAGAFGVLSPLFIAFVGFALPIALPLAHHLLTHATGSTEIIGIVVLIYLFGCLYFSRVLTRVVAETLRLRHANDALVAELQRQWTLGNPIPGIPQVAKRQSRFLLRFGFECPSI